jgi:hypothetical protein
MMLDARLSLASHLICGDIATSSHMWITPFFDPLLLLSRHTPRCYNYPKCRIKKCMTVCFVCCSKIRRPRLDECCETRSSRKDIKWWVWRRALPSPRTKILPLLSDVLLLSFLEGWLRIIPNFELSRGCGGMSLNELYCVLKLGLS